MSITATSKADRFAYDKADRAYSVLTNTGRPKLSHPEVMVGFYPDHTSGRPMAEMAIRWHDLKPGTAIPRLEVYNDGWSALAQLPELVAGLAKLEADSTSSDAFWASKPISLNDVTEMLDAAGFRRCSH